ncbi:MAG: hypothetical protein AB8B50_08025 [Pirellulaceae bacterium]
MNTQSKTADDEHGSDAEPSLGPACLVIAILSLAVFCSVCAFGSFFMFSDQFPLAKKGIETQLIPWIETSQLSPEDQEAITRDLKSLIPSLENRSLTSRQLTRLRNCLQDNPVLMWGGVEFIVAQAAAAGLTETEQEALKRISQRLLRASAERKLSRNELEFAIQNCSKVRPREQSLEVISPLTAEQIREFMKRAEQIVEQNGVPNEPYEKTAGEAFRILIDASLNVEPE